MSSSSNNCAELLGGPRALPTNSENQNRKDKSSSQVFSQVLPDSTPPPPYTETHHKINMEDQLARQLSMEDQPARQLEEARTDRPGFTLSGVGVGVRFGVNNPTISCNLSRISTLAMIFALILVVLALYFLRRA